MAARAWTDVRVQGRTYVTCQSKRDRKPSLSGINRRGSKDSRLR
ncbi:hypothetical protein ACM61V_12955 [Sphingomonas sp. TX0543]